MPARTALYHTTPSPLTLTRPASAARCIYFYARTYRCATPALFYRLDALPTPRRHAAADDARRA
jgi:hypothetical protein